MDQNEFKPSGYRQLENLRQEYASLPVPLEARERILKGIALGKRASHSKEFPPLPPQKGVIFMKLIKRTGMTAAAAMMAITILANIDPTIANAMEQIPVIGPISKVVTFRTYENNTDNFEANVQIPQVEAAPEAVNKPIEQYADELIASYEKELAQSQGEGHYSLDSSYKVVTDNNKYLCIRIDTTVVMASGAEYTKIFTIDKSTGKVISLKDLFQNPSEKLAAISSNIKEQMADQMAKDDSVSYFYNSDMPEDDFKGLSGEESFYFNQQGLLVITFDEYEVAPGYMGAVEFTIPADVAGSL